MVSVRVSVIVQESNGRFNVQGHTLDGNSDAMLQSLLPGATLSEEEDKDYFLLKTSSISPDHGFEIDEQPENFVAFVKDTANGATKLSRFQMTRSVATARELIDDSPGLTLVVLNNGPPPMALEDILIMQGISPSEGAKYGSSAASQQQSIVGFYNGEQYDGLHLEGLPVYFHYTPFLCAYQKFLSIPTATDAALQGMVAEAYPPYERGSIRDPVVIADHIVLGACHKHQDENSLKAAVRPWINDLMGDSTSYVRGGLGKDAKVDGLIEIDGLHPSIAEDKWVSMGNEMYQAALGAQKFTLADVHQTGERPPKRPKLEENPTREEKHKLPAMANTCIRLHTLTVVFMSQLEYPQRQWHYWPAARINLRPPETSSRSSPRHNLELAAFLGVLRMLLRRIVSDAKETKRLTAPVCSEVLTKKLVPLSDKPVTLIFDSDEHLRMGRNNPRVLPVYYDLDGCRHNLVAKLVPGHSYGVEAHSQSAEAGWAPKLYYHGPAFTSNQFGYDCGFDLVIMERLTGSRIPTPSHQPAVGEFKTFLKTHNIVHGDLCLSNMVFLPNGKLKVIDWDWAGKASSVRYPMRLNMSLERHPGVEACGLIEHHHDVYLLDLALRTMHIY